jgi:uncharacterized protein (TIGR04222 family)
MHPWGLSGPEFLWLYVAGLVVGIAVLIVVRQVARRPTLAEPRGPVDVTELAFLGGGALNAVTVAIARLVDVSAARANRSGQASATTSTPTGRPLDDAVLAELTTSRTAVTVMRREPVQHVLREMGESLVRRGLLVAPTTSVRVRRLAPVALYVVLAVGVVRWINGIANDLPTDYLSTLLVCTLFLLWLLNFRLFTAPRARTVHGDRVVAEVRRKGAGATKLERMAVRGPHAFDDRSLLHALTKTVPFLRAPTSWSYASAVSFEVYLPKVTGDGSAGGSSSSGSGSSCGGGGGCGGGSN